jgi:hypothetical protein
MRYMKSDFPIVFLGDNHGAWSALFYEIERRDIRDCFLISVGDCGIGFESKEYTLNLFEILNRDFKERNIYFKAIRGNHDNPSYFKVGNVHLPHFELLEDYTIIKYRNKTIQFIGGAISIDRTGRREGSSYWKEEGVVFNKELCEEVDILVTHTAPSYCFPQTLNEMVYSWADQDMSLISELAKERAIMDDIFNICKPTLHFYGHFHESWSEDINGCKHKLLGIDELWESMNFGNTTEL